MLETCCLDTVYIVLLRWPYLEGTMVGESIAFTAEMATTGQPGLKSLKLDFFVTLLDASRDNFHGLFLFEHSASLTLLRIFLVHVKATKMKRP